MCTSPLPLVNSKVTGPLTVSCRSNPPSTPECETHPAVTAAVRTASASHAFLFVRVIELGGRAENDKRQAILPIKLYEKAQLEVP
jgi:hypothetical protein